MGKRYRDEIAAVCHDIMKDAYNAGGVSDAEMLEFEADCFEQVPPPPEPDAVKTHDSATAASATATAIAPA
ncbi:MAG: hypothetical protein FWG66_10905 [Spirochaetes bacterium]|nr:hypothetical protein [Spirochaetota bacterium]